MSSEYRKIKYNEEGPYGSTDEFYLYVHYHNTCDVTNIYDHHFNHVMSYGDRPEGMAWAIAQIEGYTDRLEMLTTEDFEKFKESKSNFRIDLVKKLEAMIEEAISLPMGVEPSSWSDYKEFNKLK